MRVPKSIESLYSFGIKGLQSSLRREGYSLGKLETILKPGTDDRVETFLSWSSVNSWGEKVDSLEVKVTIRRDTEGLFLEVSTRGGVPMGDPLRLVKRESNLKPGTFRYYILDPYSPPTQETLCEKVYYLSGVCEFVSRSILQSHRVLYRQQRKGKKDRYYFGIKEIPREKTKYRKSHYRGKITPFWERYEYLREEKETRFIEYCVGNGFSEGIISPEVEREIILDYCKHTGRKTLPKRKSLYSWRRVSHHRRKLR